MCGEGVTLKPPKLAALLKVVSPQRPLASLLEVFDLQIHSGLGNGQASS